MNQDTSGDASSGSFSAGRSDQEGRGSGQAMARAGHLAFHMARLQALCVAVRLALPDHLAGGPRSADELAAAAGAHPDALNRMLRFLALEGWVAVAEDGRYALTPLGRELCAEDPSGARDFLLACLERGWPTWGALLHSVMTGGPAFDHVVGRGYFEDMALNPANRAAVSRLLAEGAREISSALKQTIDFSAFRQVVDVGGGGGILVGALLEACPDLTAVLLDRAEAVERARAYLGPIGVADRCLFEVGDFFRAVPAGGDVYILSWILHDWDDERAIAILTNCRRAMAPEARLLVLETLMAENPLGSPHAVALDLGMLVTTGGRERTETEYRRLLESAGFRLVRILPTPSSRGTSILEALPSSHPVSPSRP